MGLGFKRTYHGYFGEAIPTSDRAMNDLTGIGGFYSNTGRRLAQIGCFGFLGFIGYAISSERLIAATSILALIGIGYGIEFVQRLRNGITLGRLPPS